jgi:RNA polymerase sigma factor (sigma-70 family)
MLDEQTTHASLLVRLRDPRDRAAWERLVEVYRPAIVRLARRRGLQPTDAEDIAQQVLARLQRVIPDWDHHPERGRFRNWLQLVTTRCIINLVTRRTDDRGRGGSEFVDCLQAVPDEAAESELVELEWRRAQFQAAAKLVRREFAEATWQAFWMTTIEDTSPEVAAEQLGKSLGSVYAARSRVMRRLREQVEQLDREFDAETT